MVRIHLGVPVDELIGDPFDDTNEQHQPITRRGVGVRNRESHRLGVSRPKCVGHDDDHRLFDDLAERFVRPHWVGNGVPDELVFCLVFEQRRPQ